MTSASPTLGVLETIALLRAKAASSLDLTAALLDRIDRHDPEITAFVRTYADSARDECPHMPHPARAAAASATN
ncbi:hypothetical protein [Nocardia brasiliensis]|uniref:hypothetical protein n=1 Tax=Nocardia brasiliensis TaxID=37326 RepID=UPI0004A6D6EC|nr:hypothetical protein [Nocardia brasiliensis]